MLQDFDPDASFYDSSEQNSDPRRDGFRVGGVREVAFGRGQSCPADRKVTYG